MKRLTAILITALMMAAFGHAQADSLEHIKIAADGGDPDAQDRLAQWFMNMNDPAQAELWYRKAAQQGNVHAQGQLGNLLLHRHDPRNGGIGADAAAGVIEAVEWIKIAANQGDKQEQSMLANIYLDGRLVQQDLIEAYKWAELSTRIVSTNGTAKSGDSPTRDAAILKMDGEQIAEARDRVRAFAPRVPTPAELPKPAWIQKIKLTGISGVGSRRFATIGKDTYEKGEQGAMKINGKLVAIRCIDITESNAIILVEGVQGSVTLGMN